MNHTQPFISDGRCSHRRCSRLSFSFQINPHCSSAGEAMISIGDSSSMAESGFFVRWVCTWWTSCSPKQSISDTARAAKFLPGFFGVRVKEPFTVRQWELSPPQTPHLSSTLVEPISLSQPTFWGQQKQSEVGLTLMQPEDCPQETNVSGELLKWMLIVLHRSLIHSSVQYPHVLISTQNGDNWSLIRFCRCPGLYC